MFKFSAQNSKPTEKKKNKLLIALLFTLTKKKSMSAFFSSLFRAAGRVYSSRLVAAALPWPLKILQPIPPAAHLESTPKSPTTRTVHPVRARSAAARRSGIGKKEAPWWFLRANLAAIRSDLVRIRVLAGSKWVLRADSFAGSVERWDLGADSAGFALQDLGFWRQWW